tara:strand:+ start:258 stop:686 length:429 start_codon:yes stop_codon:yes gene_type:complete
MQINGLTDKRYKLSQQDVEDIRELKKLGFTNKELALAFAVSESTILYWYNDESRAKQRLKNAKRKLRPNEDIEHKKARDLQKRKENWEETPVSFFRHRYHSRKSDKRAEFKTMYGHDREVWDKIAEKGLLNRPNAKIVIEEE